MAAVTPNVTQHAHLPPMASRFVDVAALPWQKTIYPGVEAKTLLIERSSGLLTVLLKMDPGAKLPDHEHDLIEQTWVLEGSLECVWRPAGSRHEAWAGPRGGLMIAMFQIPNRFYEANGREIDFLGNDWKKSWSEAYERLEAAKI
jgi:hypothetical protein